MDEAQFSAWRSWQKRTDFEGSRSPGIYVIAYSADDISEQSFSWRPEIIYIGMTNSRGGLKQRLHQFDDTLKGRIRHGGADRMLLKYPEYEVLSQNLYVATYSVSCDVKSCSPVDLRIMGDVLQAEFYCFAAFVERFGKLPEFNDQALSKKWSHEQRL